jgi:hypothetical protein
MYEVVTPRSLAICATGTFFLRAAMTCFFIFATSAADLRVRLPSPLFLFAPLFPLRSFCAIPEKMIRNSRSAFVNFMMWPLSSVVSYASVIKKASISAMIELSPSAKVVARTEWKG